MREITLNKADSSPATRLFAAIIPFFSSILASFSLSAGPRRACRARLGLHSLSAGSRRAFHVGLGLMLCLFLFLPLVSAIDVLMLRDTSDTTSCDTQISSGGVNATWDTQDAITSTYSHTGSTAKVTINTDGIYRVSYGFGFNRTTSSTRLTVRGRILVNGQEQNTCFGNSYTRSDATSQVDDGVITSDCLLNLSSSDVLALNTGRTSSSSVACTRAIDESWLHLQRLENPDVILVRDSAGEQSMDSRTGNLLDWDTLDQKTATYTFTAGADNITVNSAGLYRVSYGVTLYNNYTTDANCRSAGFGKIYVNGQDRGVGFAESDARCSSNCRYSIAKASALLELEAGDYVQIYGGRAGTFSTNFGTEPDMNWFQLEKVSNANAAMVEDPDGGQDITVTSVTIDYGTTNRSDSDYTVINDTHIQATRNGIHRVEYSVFNNATSGSTRGSFFGRLQVNDVDQDVCWSQSYNRGLPTGQGGNAPEATNYASCLVNLTAGDNLSVRIGQWSAQAIANMQTESTRSWLHLQSLEYSAPSLSSLTLNATDHPSNSTDANLTAWPTGSNYDDIIYDWRLEGVSIATLNMNFDVNNSNGTGKVEDYSSFGNNASTVNNPKWNATGGWNGTGVYEFNETAYITIPNDASIDFDVNDSFSISLWVKAESSYTGGGTLLYKAGDPWTAYPYHMEMWSGNLYFARYSAPVDPIQLISNEILPADTWWHYVITVNGSSKNLTMYTNGMYDASITDTTMALMDSDNPTEIGGTRYGGGWNGSIDNLVFFNHTLSAEQAAALFNNRTDLIVSQETTLGENWSVCATPNDGTSDGSEVCSNTLEILAPSSGPSCGDTLTSDTTLIENLNCDGTAFTIGADNIVVDGAGFTITGNTSGYAFNLGFYSNVTIKNVVVTNFSTFVLVNGQNHTIYNNTATTLDDAIYIEDASHNANISGNNLTTETNTGATGINAYSGNNIIIERNIITTGTVASYGVQLDGALVDNALVQHNTISTSCANSCYGVYIYQTVNSTVWNNTIISQEDGFYVTGTTTGLNITENDLTATNGAHGLNIISADAPVIVRNTINITADSSYALMLDSSSVNNAYVLGNNITTSGNGALGVYIWQSDNNTFVNNTITTTNADAIYVLEVGNEWLNLSGNTLSAGGGNQELQVDNATLILKKQTIAAYSFQNVKLPKVYDNTHGKIDFNEDFGTVSGSDFSSEIKIGPRWAYVDSTISSFNKSANVTLYNNPFNPARLMRDGKYCDTCVNLTSFSASTLIFSVTGWSNYSFGNGTPVIESVILNATDHPSNLTSANLTTYPQNTNNTGFILYDWRLDNTSIAIFNTNFDVNNSASNGNFKDYSTYGNDAAGGGSYVWNATGGRNGSGAMECSGWTCFGVSHDSSFANLTEITAAAWVYLGYNEYLPIFSKYHWTGSTNAGLFYINFQDDNTTVVGFRGTGGFDYLSSSEVPQGEWVHYVFTYNGSNASIYLNGALDNTATSSVGYLEDNETDDMYTAINGTMDEALILNRSLTAEQVLALYNNRTDLIVSQETSVGENWSVCATPNNIDNDGNETCSNNLVILGATPTISSLTLNATDYPDNTTNANLTAWATGSNYDDVIYDWRLEGVSIATLNMNFDVNNSNGTGKTKDYSSHGNNGSVNGAIWNATGGWNGSGAYHFLDGGYISVSDDDSIDFDVNDSFSIAFWFKRDSSINADGYMLLKHGSPWNNYPYNFKMYTNGNFEFARYSGGLVPQLFSNYNVPADQWWHVVVTVNGTSKEMTMYTNGTYDDSATDTTSAPIGTNNPITIGAGVGGADHWNGTIDNLMFFNRTLSAEQAASLYQNQSHKLSWNETTIGDNWSVCATPNDGTQDGTEVCSNTVEILEITPTLSSLTLNATDDPNNYTTANLTAWATGTNYDDIIYDWRHEGNSIAVLNMNFDVNNSAGTGETKDYSTNKFNGTVVNATWNATGGWNGSGAYLWADDDDYINVTSSTLKDIHNSGEVTYEVWYHFSEYAVVYTRGDAYNCEYEPIITTTSARLSGCSQSGLFADYSSVAGWNHVVIAISKAADDIRTYHNGILINQTTITAVNASSTTPSRVLSSNEDSAYIGTTYNNGAFADWYIGHIDNFRIYNRSLTPEQALLLYQNRSDKLSFNETNIGENWSVCATPNDGSQDGSEVCSNTVEIQVGIPEITSLVLNATDNPSNLTTANLTAWATGSDYDDIIYDWRKENTSIYLLNMNFDVNNSAGTDVYKDYTTYKHNGTHIGYWNATGGWNGTGAHGSAGYSDYVQIDDDGTFSTANFTIAMWFKTDADLTYRQFFTRLNSSDDEIIYLRWNNAQNLQLFIKTEGGGGYRQTSGTLNPNQWYHVAATYDGTTARIYMHGEFNTSSTFSSPINNTDSDHIRLASGFDGHIDNVIVTDYVMSAAQIRALFNNRTDLIVSNETTIGDNWSVCATPNDGTQDGSEICSNTVQIQTEAAATPTISSLTLNATDHPSNLTTANLTAWPTGSNYNDIIYDWRKEGVSIATLNMNFDVNNSNGTGKQRDYSSFGNNASTVNNPKWNATGGWNGSGAFEFNESTYLTIPDDSSIDFDVNDSFSIALWLKRNTYYTNGGYILYKHGDPWTSYPYLLEMWNGNLQFAKYSGAGPVQVISNEILPANTWWHYIITFNGTSKNMSMYTNGVLDSTTTDTLTAPIGSSNPASIGGGPGVTGWNGSIDNFIIYNHTLSAEQVNALFNNRTDLIVSQETNLGENWSVCATPNDGTQDGSEVCSNTVEILEITPTISSLTLNATDHPNNTTNANLTAWATGTNYDDIIYDWRVEGTSLAVVNMNFDVNNSGGTGWTKDYSSFNNNGTVPTGSPEPTWNVTGGWNGSAAYYFDGNDHLRVPYDSSLAVSNITVAAWVKFDSLGDWQQLVARYYFSGGDSGSWAIFNDEAQNVEWYLNTDSWMSVEATSLSTGQWYHIVGTYNGTDQTLYINGQVNDTTPKTGAIATSSHPVGIGAAVNTANSTQDHFNGHIDNVLILNRSLSAEQITALYNNRTDLIVSQETNLGDNWSVCATPNDGTTDGSEVCSNTVEILDAASDTCTYSSGDWNVDGSDNCVITTNTDVGGNNIIVDGAGTFTVQSNVTNFAQFIASSNVRVITNSGGHIR